MKRNGEPFTILELIFALIIWGVITIPWDGMHDEAVKKIMKIIEKKT